jgi:hypothetical protein
MRCAGAFVSYTARLAETEAESARLRTLLDFRKTLGGKLELTRFRGHQIPFEGRGVHDAQESSSIPA